jgi:hypothetical protein
MTIKMLRGQRVKHSELKKIVVFLLYNFWPWIMDRKTYPLPTLAGMNIRKNRENVGDGFVYVCLCLSEMQPKVTD